MKEIDVILIELHRLLTELKDSGGTDELQVKTQGLFARANPLIKEIDGLDEMERIRKNAYEVVTLASQILSEMGIRFLKNPESLLEFLNLFDMRTKEMKG